jgi:hypothetical protein
VRRAAALAAVLAVALGGCGESGKTEDQLVRETLDAFGKAISAKDYQRLCDDLLAPKLLESLREIGLPCEIALQRALQDTEQPTLAIGTVAVTGKSARAEIRTTAKGQPPSKDVIQLTKTDAGWRVSSLGGQAPAPPSSPRQGEPSPPPAPQPTAG